MFIRNRNRRILACVAIVTIVTILAPPPASALLEQIELQTQLQYQLFETKPLDGPISSRSGFNTTYNIGFRRPILPFPKLITHLTVNSIENNDSLGRQQNRSLNFNMSTSERTYKLNAGADSVTYSSFTTANDGRQLNSSGGNSNYFINFNWNESPAMPSANIQFRNNRTTTGADASYNTKQWIAGTVYELRPFTMTLDQISQNFSFDSPTTSSRTSTTRRRAGINFDQQLMSGLNLQANLNRESTKSILSDGRSSSLTGDTRNIRLTAIPTPSLLLTAERSIQETDQDSLRFSQNNKTTNTNYGMRSEMLPGLSLTLNHQIGEQDGDLDRRKNNSTSANVAARLTSDSNLALGWNKSSYDNGDGIEGNSQTNMYGSLQMPIGLDNDLTTDFGTLNSKSGGSDDFKGKYFGVSLRNRTRSDLALGIGYRWSMLDTLGTIPNSQRTNSLDLDASWFPASNMGINARLSYSSNNSPTVGSSISDHITPTVDVRWDVSSGANLILRYNFNRARQWDWTQAALLEQETRGLSGRLSYRLNNDSSLDLTYDFLSSEGGGTQWQRAFRAFFTTKL